MPLKVRRLPPVVRLSDRVLGPVQRLARMAGVSPSEIVEFVLEELFEGDVAPPPAPAPAVSARPPRLATVTPITRARRHRGAALVDLRALRSHAEQVRQRAQRAREHATAACEAAGSARARASRGLLTPSSG